MSVTRILFTSFAAGKLETALFNLPFAEYTEQRECRYHLSYRCSSLAQTCTSARMFDRNGKALFCSNLADK